jgi:peptidoglycan-associated lipoprotein
MKNIILSMALLGLLAACASEAPPPEPTPPAASAEADKAAADAQLAAQLAADKAALEKAEADRVAAEKAAADAAAAAAAVKADPLNDPASPLAKRSVYFPFDVDAIQPDDKATIQAHGKYLSEHADVKIRVEGNADERGSSEYNLALGQRRANNTKKALMLSGAKANQIETVSFGEEKPKALGHDEASWAQNRRADINYSK